MSHPELAQEGGKVQKRISAGQRALRKLRLRVAAACFAVGILMTVGYEFLERRAIRSRLGEDCDGAFHWHVHAILLNICGLGRLIGFSMAPLSGDIWMLRLTLLIDFTITGSLLEAALPQLFDDRDFGWHTIGDYCALVLVVCFLVSTFAAMFWRDPLKMQRHLWLSISLWLGFSLPVFFLGALGESIQCRYFSPHWWYVVAIAVCFYIARRPSIRFALQARISYMCMAHQASHAAAGIAGLIGDCKSREALSIAAHRFRCIRLCDVRYEDIADNRPSPELFDRSFPTKLRSCDAFVSHSWSEDPAAKWRQLQRWRTEFLAKNNREPTIWLDKACIDQNNIDADLRVLPIFLSGCRQLLVLCGPTYLSRLWCIVELFTFVHMGGDINGIDIRKVERSDLEAGDDMAIEESFKEFDAERCDCFLQEDKEKILGVVHAAFGDLQSFNRAVQEIFARVRRCSRHISGTFLSEACGSSSGESLEGESEAESEEASEESEESAESAESAESEREENV